MDVTSICASLKLGDLIYSGTVYEWNGTPSNVWRNAPRTAILGRSGFALISNSGASTPSFTVVFRASSLETLRVTDLLINPHALTAGALNAFELRIESCDGGSASPSSSSSPTHISIVANDGDAKLEWIATLFGALIDAAPVDIQLDKAWSHKLLRCTLHSAAATNDVETVRAIARFGPSGIEAVALPNNIDAPPYVDINATDADAATPLHIAASLGHTDVIAALLEYGADVHATNADGDTPLHCAISAGCATAALILTVNGAPQEALSLLGATPLASLLTLSTLLDARDDTEATAKELRGVAEALLSHGAPPRDADGEGFTPAHRVGMLFGARGLVKALSRKNTNWNARALLNRLDMVQVSTSLCSDRY